MSTRIDGSSGLPAAATRGPVGRAAAQSSAAETNARSLRRDLVSTFEVASRLDVTSDVLSEIRDRLVTLRAGLQVSSDGEERKAFLGATLGSIRQLVDMAELGPVQWPDVPPRDVGPDEVLSPLRESLAATLETEVSIPDLERAVTNDVEPALASSDPEPEDPTAFVDRAISKIDAARRQLSDARGQMGERAADAIGGHMRMSASGRPRFHDGALAEASARAMRERFTADPAAAVRAMGKLDPDAVLTLVARVALE